MALNNRPRTFRDAWVAFLDVYGFSYMLRNIEATTLFERLDDATDSAIKFLRSLASCPRYYFLSDNIFLVFPIDRTCDADEEIGDCIRCITELMEIYQSYDFPLRGGIARGEAHCAPFTLAGQAVIEAVAYEKSVPFPAVFLPAVEARKKPLDNIDTARFHDFPAKPVGTAFDGTQSFHAMPIFPITLGRYITLAEQKSAQFGHNGPKHVAATWELAIHHARLQFKRR